MEPWRHIVQLSEIEEFENFKMSDCTKQYEKEHAINGMTSHLYWILRHKKKPVKITYVCTHE